MPVFDEFEVIHNHSQSLRETQDVKWCNELLIVAISRTKYTPVSGAKQAPLAVGSATGRKQL